MGLQPHDLGAWNRGADPSGGVSGIRSDCDEVVNSFFFFGGGFFFIKKKRDERVGGKGKRGLLVFERLATNELAWMERLDLKND